MSGKPAHQKPSPDGKNGTWRLPVVILPVAFFLIELFSFVFLSTGRESASWKFFAQEGYQPGGMGGIDLWPLAFGFLWSLILTGLVRLLPEKAGRVVFGLLYFLTLVYAAVQTGYFHMFREMMWLSDFRYASEGADYISVLLHYPFSWWLSIAALVAFGVFVIVRFPRKSPQWKQTAIAGAMAGLAVLGAVLLPKLVFLQEDWESTHSTGSSHSGAETAYENMFNTHRLYQVCGIYQTAIKDLYANYLHPLMPSYQQEKEEAKKEIDEYFAKRGAHEANEMTGIFAGKNVVLVLMESMDDWALGEHTPTINRLMAEGINFTDFYTPVYGGVRTFNSEFCANTGSFLSSQGGYAFNYVSNDYSQSMASSMRAKGYSALVYHYNSPSFYSRGEFEPAMGYEAYVSYGDYVTKKEKELLFDDQFLFDHEKLSESFFREGPKLNFIITRAAHMSYTYDEPLSEWGLKKYPQYEGMTGNEEEDCMYLKARLVDDLFARLLAELAEHGELENTVIVAMTDHYTYGIVDEQLVLDRSGVEDLLLAERTPCFIWSADGPRMEVNKTLNTSDLLPTVLNLMGIESGYSYIGQDAFDPDYVGYALFSNGSWISNGNAWSSTAKQFVALSGKAPDLKTCKAMEELVNEFVRINNLILETDYYAGK